MKLWLDDWCGGVCLCINVEISICEVYNFVRRQILKYFGHVTRHNDSEKTIVQGMVAGKRNGGKP